MADPLILVLDEGTTSTRAMLFGLDGSEQGVAQRELVQHYPAPGWVEHDAAEIWERTLACAQEMVTKAGGAQKVAAIGITNQRETVVAWDKATGQPLCNAIVWQDRRTADFCAELKADGHEPIAQRKTGLLLDPYFSATKMRWMLDNVPAVKDAATAGNLAFGTIDSWLIWNLTGGRCHVTDASNASRTLLMSLEGGWDSHLCGLFGVPVETLPDIIDSALHINETDHHLFDGEIKICGIAGDQQAATIGQGCLSPGETKATYGTGAFVLTNMGEALPKSGNRLLGTVLYQIAGERHYALEGSVFVAGSLIKWLRDSLGLIESAKETEALAHSVQDSGGVVVIPALSGLGAPHWRPDALAAISGLSFAATKAHVVRAALEAMAHQTRDLATAFANDGRRWRSLKVDGGMAANDWMVQDIADILDLEVFRPDFVETTALGAAMLAAVGGGHYSDLQAAAKAMIGSGSSFSSQMDEATRATRLSAWKLALEKI